MGHVPLQRMRVDVFCEWSHDDFAEFSTTFACTYTHLPLKHIYNARRRTHWHDLGVDPRTKSRMLSFPRVSWARQMRGSSLRR